MAQITHNYSFGRLNSAIRCVVLIATLGSSLAEARQPTNASPLLGTWVNVNSTGVLARIIITDVSGDFEVHPYGFCSPTLCAWPALFPALRFSNSISSTTAIGFNGVSYSYATRYMEGHLIKTPTGQTLLEVTTQIKFPDRDSRQDYQMTERLRLK
jgi:hypothetical protein